MIHTVAPSPEQVARNIYCATNLSQRNDAYAKSQERQFIDLAAPHIETALHEEAAAERAACARDVCPRCAAGQMQARKNPLGEGVHAEPDGVTLCRAAGIWERGLLEQAK